MKKNMLNTMMLSFVADAAITISQETFAVPEDGGTVTVNVTTTAKEWGAYATENFIKVDYENSQRVGRLCYGELHQGRLREYQQFQGYGDYYGGRESYEL